MVRIILAQVMNSMTVVRWCHLRKPQVLLYSIHCSTTGSLSISFSCLLVVIVLLYYVQAPRQLLV